MCFNFSIEFFPCLNTVAGFQDDVIMFLTACDRRAG